MTITQQELDRLWSDPAHWTPQGFYRCAGDPRLMVLKRPDPRSVGSGWTLNLAHRRASFLLGGILLVSVAPLLANIALGTAAPSWLFLVSLLTPLAVFVLTAAWLSR